ncbi:MAG: tetratricopeptide repeat protein [Bdellovibrionota bacterium]
MTIKNSRRVRLFLAVSALWIAIGLTYSNSFTIAFQFDDTHTVQSNLYIRSLKHLPRFFVDSKTYSYRPENSGYRPMTTTAVAFGFALSKLETWGYHLIKLIEHCLVALLLFGVALRLLPRSKSGEVGGFDQNASVAWFGALIFGVHRANTETVNYISAISTLQAGLFFLLSFYLYLRFRESKRKSTFALSVFAYFLSTLSKEEGITLPAMIFLYEWIYGRASNEGYLKALREKGCRWAKLVVPYALAAVLFVALRTVIQPDIADASRGNVPRFDYFITQFRSWLHYWGLFFWPVELNADNLSFGFSETLADPRVLGALAVHLMIWVVAWFARRRNRFFFFSVCWIYVTVLPASSVFPLVEAVNEHRMYIPYMMLSVLAVWGVFEGARRVAARLNRGAKGAVIPACIFLGVCSVALALGAHARNEVWQTDVSLWADIYEKNPESPRAMNVLGVSLVNRGEFDRGTPLLEKCHQIAPQYLPCIVHLSIAYAHYKKFDRGLELLKAGHHLDPNYVHINYHLGSYYKDHYGDYEKARKHLRLAHEFSSGRFFQATVKLAEMSLEEGRIEEGVSIAESILRMDRSNGDAWEVYAKALLLSNDLSNALAIFTRLLEAAPDSFRYQLDVANVAERVGDLRRARELYEKAALSKPTLIQAWKGLARVTERGGDLALMRRAQGRVADLKRSGRWDLLYSMFFVDEGQVGRVQ